MQKVGIDVERKIRLQAHFWKDTTASPSPGSSRRLAAIITHPHPAFGKKKSPILVVGLPSDVDVRCLVQKGGDMRNNVTVALFEALSRSGCFPGGVVKFNFRGLIDLRFGLPVK